MIWTCRWCPLVVDLTGGTPAEQQAVQVSHACPKKGKRMVNLTRTQDADDD
jgi:hypothetical protein